MGVLSAKRQVGWRNGPLVQCIQQKHPLGRIFICILPMVHTVHTWKRPQDGGAIWSTPEEHSLLSPAKGKLVVASKLNSKKQLSGEARLVPL